MPANELRELLAFEARDDLSDNSPPGDEYGNVEGEFETRFTIKARIQPLTAGERVMADRLSGVQPVVIRVRHTGRTIQITPGWRARDVRKGTLFNITGSMNKDEKRRWLDILATAGGAA